MRKGFRNKLIIIILIVIVSTVIEGMALGSIAKAKRETKVKNAYIYGQNIASTVQLSLDNLLKATETLKYFYLQLDERIDDYFDEAADIIMADNPLISSLYIAPDAVIQAAYPDVVKESTIGFEMLKDPDQGPRAQLAIDTRKITIAGPHNLIEGGVGLIIRNPIFENGRFLGFTIVILDWNKFIAKLSGNSTLSTHDYNYAILKKDQAAVVSDADGFIFRNTDKKVGDKVQVMFGVPNDIWYINVEPADGWLAYKEMGGQIVISITLTLTVIAAVILFMLSADRKQQLNIKQAENIAKNQYMAQLAKALEETKKANAAKTVFLSRMSHDIRTPLNGIIGLLEISDKHADDVELLAEYRKKQMIAAKHLLSLISDVLELSKMDDENVQLSHEAFNLLETTEDVLTIISSRASETGIKLSSSDLKQKIENPLVYGSPLHVRQILLNILSNAIKYNKPEGSVFFLVDEITVDEKRVKYKFTISDTGIGMKEEFLEHIFEPFSQEHNDVLSVYHGTGLGMSIVKTLVDKMKGTIEVKSQEGQGSTFKVVIPFDIASEQDITQKIDVKDVNIAGIKVLLVEDNELNTEIATEILADLGVQVFCASNGKEAFDAFALNPKGTFDCILMDLMMPVLDGYGATKLIRQFNREDAGTIPIIAMTANAFAEDASRCREAGMDGHIAKPINTTELVEKIATVVFSRTKNQ